MSFKLNPGCECCPVEWWGTSGNVITHYPSGYTWRLDMEFAFPGATDAVLGEYVRSVDGLTEDPVGYYIVYDRTTKAMHYYPSSQRTNPSPSPHETVDFTTILSGSSYTDSWSGSSVTVTPVNIETFFATSTHQKIHGVCEVDVDIPDDAPSPGLYPIANNQRVFTCDLTGGGFSVIDADKISWGGGGDPISRPISGVVEHNLLDQLTGSRTGCFDSPTGKFYHLDKYTTGAPLVSEVRVMADSSVALPWSVLKQAISSESEYNSYKPISVARNSSSDVRLYLETGFNGGLIHEFSLTDQSYLGYLGAVGEYRQYLLNSPIYMPDLSDPEDELDVLQYRYDRPHPLP